MSIGKLLAKEIQCVARRETSGVRREIKKARARMAALNRTVKRQAAAIAELTRSGGASARPRKRRRLRLSQARRRALKHQGQYLGAVRRLSARDKTRVKKLRATKGVAAAIALAKRLRRT